MRNPRHNRAPEVGRLAVQRRFSGDAVNGRSSWGAGALRRTLHRVLSTALGSGLPAAVLASSISAGLVLGGCTSSASDDVTAGNAAPSGETSEGSEETDLLDPQSAESYLAEGPGVVEEDLMLEGEGHKIPATLALPADAGVGGPVPAVVFLHGTGGHRHETDGAFVMLAEQLASKGVASIRIDFVGAGESSEPSRDFTPENAIADAQSAFHQLEKDERIDGDRLGIFGWSQGGIHAFTTAALTPQVKAVCTWAAPAEGMDATEEQREEAAEHGYFEVDYDWSSPMQVGQAWIDQMDALDLEGVVGGVDVPILLISGEDDWVVPLENAQRLHKAAPIAETLIIPGADHTFNVTSGDLFTFNNATTAVADFFSATL